MDDLTLPFFVRDYLGRPLVVVALIPGEPEAIAVVIREDRRIAQRGISDLIFMGESVFNWGSGFAMKSIEEVTLSAKVPS